MFHELFEATFGQLNRKQKSVTRLFPDFFTNPVKVKGVIEKGGVRLQGIDKDKWTFTVHSGTEEDLWYDVVVRWKNVEKDVERLVSDRRNWTKDKKRADLKKVAAKLFQSGNVELECTCPADLYWGKHYIRSQDKYQAKYGDPETRYPEVRNPKLYGAYCKHIQVLMRTLPFYKSTIANWLGKEFKDLIARAEGSATQTAKQFQVAGQALAKRSARESKAPGGGTFTLQAVREQGEKFFQDAITSLIGSYKLWTKDFSEDTYWLLPDGNSIAVTSHSEAAKSVNLSVHAMEVHGCFRVFVDKVSRRITISGLHTMNRKQQAWIRSLLVSNEISLVEVENDRTSDWDELGPSGVNNLMSGIAAFYNDGV